SKPQESQTAENRPRPGAPALLSALEPGTGGGAGPVSPEGTSGSSTHPTTAAWFRCTPAENHCVRAHDRETANGRAALRTQPGPPRQRWCAGIPATTSGSTAAISAARREGEYGTAQAILPILGHGTLRPPAR